MHTPTKKIRLLRVSRLCLVSLPLIAASVYSGGAFSDDAMPSIPQGQPQDQANQSETPATTSATTPTTVPPKTTINSPNVVRALLTSAIVDKEPADQISSINKDQERIYFFTEFSGLKGKMIKHRWKYQGKVMAEVNFNVGSEQWRCYSSKNLLPEWLGMWTVSVIDDRGQVLAETQFEVTN